MKSWRTTTIGLVCWVMALFILRDNWKVMPHQYWGASLTPYALPMALFAAGLGLIHARDHKHKDPPSE